MMKITKAEVLRNIRAMVETMDMVGEIPADVVIEYCDVTLAQMDKKNEKARERAAKKRAENDALTDVVAGMLTDEWQTADMIEKAIGDADVTKAKIVNRMRHLIDDGIAVKENRKVDDKRKAMCYRLAGVIDEVDE